ncbi:MAG: hypothetical protein AAF517_03195 [Planctomycetota bacterium]
MGGLDVGDKVGNFEGLDDAGKPWKYSEHAKKKRKLAVFFYPAALTGG